MSKKKLKMYIGVCSNPNEMMFEINSTTKVFYPAVVNSIHSSSEYSESSAESPEVSSLEADSGLKKSCTSTDTMENTQL